MKALFRLGPLVMMIALGSGPIASATQQAARACGAVAKACTDAGYPQNHHKPGQGIAACMNNLLAGNEVISLIDNKTHILVSPSDISACNEARNQAPAHQ